MMSYLLGSVQNKNIFFFLHLEIEICKPEHLCRTTVLHYNAVLSQI